MPQDNQQSNFERSPYNKFTDNQVNGRRAKDKFRFHELCWHCQAELTMTSEQSENVHKQIEASMQIYVRSVLNAFGVLDFGNV